MNAVIYARVSSSEQVAGYSIEAQIDQSRAWANEQGYNVLHVYTEPGRSARSDQRPVFQRMIKNVCAGEAGIIIVHKADRFARNLLDLLQYKKLLRDNGATIYSASEEFFNGESPENELVLKVMGAMAEYVSQNIGNEAQKGMLAKARAARIELCPTHAPQTKTAFIDFSSGDWTLSQWAREAQERGYRNTNGRPIKRSTWQRIFRRKFYTGRFDWQGVEYDGDHPALINDETWQAVQAVLDGRSSGGRHGHHFWLLRGLLFSDVHQRAMTGAKQKSQRYAYYRAKGRLGSGDTVEHNIRAIDAEAQVVQHLSSIRTTNRFIPANDKLLLALLSAPDLGFIWPHLQTNNERIELLNTIFFQHGLHVDTSGRVLITSASLKPGFEIITPDSP